MHHDEVEARFATPELGGYEREEPFAHVNEWFEHLGGIAGADERRSSL